MTDLAGSEDAAVETLDEAAEPPLFPIARKCPFTPPEEYTRRRDEDPVFKVRIRWSGKEVWAITRHEHVKRVLGDATMSSSWKLPGYPLQVPCPDDILQGLELPIVGLDPPAHTVRRRALVPEFTVKRVEALRPRIEEIVDEHINAMLAAGGPTDLVDSLAVTVPSLLFCELLGVPADDVPYFRGYAEKMVKADADPDELLAAQGEILNYIDDLINDKRAAPDDDLLSRLVARNDEDGAMEQDDLMSLASFLLFGGFDTTANMISLGVMVLLDHPDQLAELRADPGLMPQAVEELLRYLSIADHSPARVVMQEDIDLDGVLIRKGEGIVALTSAANRDERIFADPDRFDIHRDARGHSAFGHGIHQCPGANLVRVELEVVFNTLFRRIPTLRLAVPADEITYKSNTLVQGVAGALPVTW